MMNKNEKPKVEVKVSANVTIPFWTAGFLYTAGVLLSQPSEAFFAAPWYTQLMAGVVVYVLWPAFLGMLHFSGTV